MTASAGLVLAAGGCERGCGRRAPGDADAGVPSSTADAGLPEDAGQLPPSIPDAAAAVNAVRPSLRACYAQQLGRRPTPRGTITFTLEVGPDGHVTAATPSARDGLDDECVACMTAGVTKAVFDRPLDGMPATVIAPFTFQSRGDPPPRPSSGAPSPLAPPRP
ncbi:MAG: AgmX/PglI C-terminal domain-containing protein [Labilithrix sp.]|nr:AgmX/PglI C-terminal domain-containing protein [Labilithrix sp.]